MKDIRQKLLAIFQVEHRDHVEQIRSLLAMIGKTGGQSAGAELEEAFRRAHSLKGAARAVDLRSVERLAHHLESLFSRVRQGVLILDKGVAAVAQQALDASEDCVTALGEKRASPGLGPALTAIERVLGIDSTAERAAEPEPASPAFQPLDTVRITAQNFDGLLKSSGGLLAEGQRQDQVTTQLTVMARQIAALEKDTENARRVAAKAAISGIAPFLDSMERRARALSRQASAVRRLQQRSAWTTNRLGKQLQQDVWQARMVPAESLLEGYRKMMRDLARDESKEIEFRATSAGVQADRGVLEALKDPLMHALRNAVSHGIEKPAERVANGKSAEGLVTLRVETRGQRLTITIEDDGRGVDLTRVAEMAVRQKILAEPGVKGHAPRDLARILFQPGFSTARSITDLSGRGMGLSVVYEAVRRLQGDVNLEPRDGGGTRLLLSVPLSISTHRLLLVSSAGQPFAIPIHWVERLHNIKRESVETVEGQPMVILDGQPTVLFSMRSLLGLGHPPGVEKESLRVMVLRSQSKRAAVSVDAFLRESDAVIQDLGPATPRDGKISGGVLLDDGVVAFALNPLELLESPGPSEAPSSWKPPKTAPEREQASILVVDDSITTRTLEKSILEAHGYRVRVAVDGIEALARLRAEKADLVIADVQMPRMNGFELLAAMKKDPGLRGIPVIMVTSLDRREDQERGLGLGADAYIVKRNFDQGELLSAIRQII